MKKTIVTALLVYFCFLLQTGVFQWISFGGIMPNLLLILTASFGFMSGEKTGLLTGFACGFLADLFCVYGAGNGSGELIGYYALLYMLIGYLNGKFTRMFYPDDLKLPLFLITVSDLSLNLICYCVMFLLRARLSFGYYFLHIILPEAVYTLIVAFLAYPLLLAVHKRIWPSERGSNESPC